jgi:CAAX protease family protein
VSSLDEVDSARQRPSNVVGVVLPWRDGDLEALAEPRNGLPLDPLLVLLFNLATIFIGGALIAPPLYWAMQALADTFPGLAGEPFRRYVSRCLLLVAFLRLRPLVRGLGARSARDIGWVSLHGNWRRLPQGLSVGLVSFAVVAIVAVVAGGRLVNPDVSVESFAGRLPSILSTMTVVAVLEETLFRGAIFGMLQQSWNWLAALALSSLLYASVHFIPTVANAGPVTIGSGLAVVAGMFKGFSEPQALMPEFLNLTLIGALLAWGYRVRGICTSRSGFTRVGSSS